MKPVLYNYDIYPKVFLGDTRKMITVQPLGDQAAFSARTCSSSSTVYPRATAQARMTSIRSVCITFIPALRRES